MTQVKFSMQQSLGWLWTSSLTWFISYWSTASIECFARQDILPCLSSDAQRLTATTQLENTHREEMNTQITHNHRTCPTKETHTQKKHSHPSPLHIHVQWKGSQTAELRIFECDNEGARCCLVCSSHDWPTASAEDTARMSPIPPPPALHH